LTLHHSGRIILRLASCEAIPILGLRIKAYDICIYKVSDPMTGFVEILQRNKLYWIKNQDLEALNGSRHYPLLDIGKLVAEELTRNPPGRHVSLDIDDFLKTYLRRLLVEEEGPSKGLILDNLGVLLEPDLDLNPVKFFLELSLDAVVVLVWDHAIIDGTRFIWDETEPGYGFQFPSHTITNMELPDEVP